MARVWTRGDLTPHPTIPGAFEITGLSATAVVEVFHNGMILRETQVNPGVLQYTRTGTTVFVFGLTPEAAADIWYISNVESEVPPMEAGAGQQFLTRYNETFYFQVYVRDADGNLLEVITDQVDGISWSYAAVGGCRDAQIVLRRPFDDLRNLDEDYHIEIWRDVDKLGQAGAQLPAFIGPNGIQFGTSHIGSRELRWGGYVSRLEPSLEDYESVQLHCLGWSSRLERLGVVNLDVNGDPVPYTNVDVAVIVRDIIDNWAVPGSHIKRTAAFGLVPDTGVIVGSIFFYSTIADALRVLAEYAGDAEWGCRQDGEFFFFLKSPVVRQTYAIGHKLKLYQPLKASDDVVNRVFFQGTGGLRATINLGPYVPKNQKDRFVTVGSVATPEEAVLWANGYAVRYGPGVPTSQRLSGRMAIGATAKWIEGVGQPLGLIRVVGGPIFVAAGERLSAELPIELATVYGGITDQSFRINAITYTMQEDNYDVSIELGARLSPFADRLTSIERKLTELRQAQQ